MCVCWLCFCPLAVMLFFWPQTLIDGPEIISYESGWCGPSCLLCLRNQCRPGCSKCRSCKAASRHPQQTTDALRSTHSLLPLVFPCSRSIIHHRFEFASFSAGASSWLHRIRLLFVYTLNTATSFDPITRHEFYLLSLCQRWKRLGQTLLPDGGARKKNIFHPKSLSILASVDIIKSNANETLLFSFFLGPAGTGQQPNDGHVQVMNPFGHTKRDR